MAARNVIDLFRARFANIKEQSKALSVIDHNVLRGRFREILVESLIAPYLPPTVELLTWTIIGAKGEKRESRNEDDVVISDHSWAPLLMGTRGRDAIIPVTEVRAQIEVKTTLKLTDLHDALKAAAEINLMSVKSAPARLVFAYDTNTGENNHIPDVLMNHLQDVGYSPTTGMTVCPIQAVCILGRGGWFLTEVNNKPGWYEVEAKDDRELLVFVTIISNSLFDNERGVGTHILDLSWLNGPNPESPLLVT